MDLTIDYVDEDEISLDQFKVQAKELIKHERDTQIEYSYAAEPPVQFRLSHLSRRSEPL